LPPQVGPQADGVEHDVLGLFGLVSPAHCPDYLPGDVARVRFRAGVNLLGVVLEVTVSTIDSRG